MAKKKAVKATAKAPDAGDAAYVKELNHAIDQMVEEGQGVVTVTVVMRDEADEYYRDARAGSYESFLVCTMLERAIKGIGHDKPHLCLFCDATPMLHEMPGIGILHPAIETIPRMIMGLCICEKCMLSDRQAMQHKLRNRMIESFSGFRPLDVHSQPGNA